MKHIRRYAGRYPHPPLPWREAPVNRTDNWDFQASPPPVSAFYNTLSPIRRKLQPPAGYTAAAPRSESSWQAPQTVPHWPLSVNCFYSDNSPQIPLFGLPAAPPYFQFRKKSPPEETRTPPASVPSSCLYTGFSRNQDFLLQIS